jgi:hypothetical protein
MPRAPNARFKVRSLIGDAVPEPQGLDCESAASDGDVSSSSEQPAASKAAAARTTTARKVCDPLR